MPVLDVDSAPEGNGAAMAVEQVSKPAGVMFRDDRGEVVALACFCAPAEVGERRPSGSARVLGCKTRGLSLQVIVDLYTKFHPRRGSAGIRLE